MKKAFVLILAMIMTISLFSACGTVESKDDKKEDTSDIPVVMTLDLFDYFAVFLEGPSPYPTCSIVPKSDEFAYVIDDMQITNYQKKELVNKFLEATYDTPEPDAKIYNGTLVTIGVSLDYDYFREYGIAFESEEFAIIVSNLEIPASYEIKDIVQLYIEPMTYTDPTTNKEIDTFWVAYYSGLDLAILFNESPLETYIIGDGYIDGGNKTLFTKNSSMTWVLEFNWDYIEETGYVFTINGREISRDLMVYAKVEFGETADDWTYSVYTLH